MGPSLPHFLQLSQFYICEHFKILALHPLPELESVFRKFKLEIWIPCRTSPPGSSSEGWKLEISMKYTKYLVVLLCVED